MIASLAARVLDDGTNRESWSFARRPVIGASDAQKLAKPESIESYLAGKIRTSDWTGNDYTRSGHRWEPMMLAWAGVPQNLALIHAVDEVGFAATPDGVRDLGRGRVALAECKAKHEKHVTGPSLGEWRQVAWQFRVIPEADYLDWIWAEIVGGDLRGEEPQSIRIYRDHPKVIELTAKVEPIATNLLARLRAALAFEQELLAS